MGPAAWREGEAKMDRLRQMDREVEVDRQRRWGRRWEGTWRKGQRREDEESLRKQTDRGQTCKEAER